MHYVKNVNNNVCCMLVCNKAPPGGRGGEGEREGRGEGMGRKGGGNKKVL